MSTPIINDVSWNVVDDSVFKGRVEGVLEKVASMLTKTLGPDGSTTIIENFGEVHVTKDGWNILKKIRFNESIDNTLFTMLLNISAQVVIRVGDGSTSSLVSANEMYKSIVSNPQLKSIRPKELVDKLSKIAARISEEILAASIKIDTVPDANGQPVITPEGIENIRRVASVSTNSDDTIPNIIAEIYAKTNNPSIEFSQSKTTRTSFEIVDGYQMNAAFLDNIFITNQETGTFEADRPLILMFDHKVELEYFQNYIVRTVQAAIASSTDHRKIPKVIVIAPHYDRFVIDQIKRQSEVEVKSTGSTSTCFLRVALVNNMSHEIFNDFAVMTGGAVIRANDAEQLADDSASLDDYIGTVDKIVIDSRKVSITGLFNRNESMYQKLINDAVLKVNEKEEIAKELSLVNGDLYEAKKRLAKLRCSMGSIQVGGNSTIEKRANYDLVEDAVRACESAFSYGYNIGGNLIIPTIIEKLRNEADLDYMENEGIYNMFEEAFRKVFAIVLKNRYTDFDVEQLANIVNESIRQGKQYNLITEKYDGNVINPCYTDIEILRAATSIISLLTTSNQFVRVGV